MNRSVNENSVNTAIGNVCTFNESAVGHQSSSLWLLRAFRLCFGSDTLRLVRTPTEQLLQHNRLHCLKQNLTHTLTYIDNIYMYEYMYVCVQTDLPDFCVFLFFPILLSRCFRHLSYRLCCCKLVVAFCCYFLYVFVITGI